MLNKEKQKTVWLAKYGWRYKALNKWLETHSAPPSEKSTISQLKSVSIAFGENIAERLSRVHKIPGIYESPSAEILSNLHISDLEQDLLDQFRRISAERKQIEIIGYVKGKADEQTANKSNTASSKAKKEEKAA